MAKRFMSVLRRLRGRVQNAYLNGWEPAPRAGFGPNAFVKRGLYTNDPDVRAHYEAKRMVDENG